jgi:hypothetical protein
MGYNNTKQKPSLKRVLLLTRWRHHPTWIPANIAPQKRRLVKSGFCFGELYESLCCAVSPGIGKVFVWVTLCCLPCRDSGAVGSKDVIPTLETCGHVA